MNITDEAKSYLARLIRIEEERRDNAESKKEIGAEMKSAGLLAEEIAGIKLAVKRHFEEEAKRKFRETAEEFAAALGDYAETPLGSAAVEARVSARSSEPVQRAVKKFVDTVKKHGNDVSIELPGRGTTHISGRTGEVTHTPA